MSVNSLPKTVTRQHLGCDLNPGPSAPESSTYARLPSHPDKKPIWVPIVDKGQTDARPFAYYAARVDNSSLFVRHRRGSVTSDRTVHCRATASCNNQAYSPSGRPSILCALWRKLNQQNTLNATGRPSAYNDITARPIG